MVGGFCLSNLTHALIMGLGHRNGMQSLREELAALQEQQGRARGKLEAAERRLADGENTLGGLAAQIENLKAEIGTSLEAQLSAQDRAELQKLNPEIQRMEVRLWFRVCAWVFSKVCGYLFLSCQIAKIEALLSWQHARNRQCRVQKHNCRRTRVNLA